MTSPTFKTYQPSKTPVPTVCSQVGLPSRGQAPYRIIQFVEVYEAAVRLFEGDREAARQWMKSPVKGLGGKAPMEMLSIGIELDAVLDMIGRLEHGIVV